MTKRKETINAQTENEDLTIINATNENFVMHCCLILTIALKINDRNEKNKNFTAVNEANEANETNENETITIDEAAKREKEINKAIIVDDEAVNDEKNVAIAKSKYLTKVFSTTLIIIIFNS